MGEAAASCTRTTFGARGHGAFSFRQEKMEPRSRGGAETRTRQASVPADDWDKPIRWNRKAELAGVPALVRIGPTG